jgi:hypothetical protein
MLFPAERRLQAMELGFHSGREEKVLIHDFFLSRLALLLFPRYFFLSGPSLFYRLHTQERKKNTDNPLPERKNLLGRM